MRRRSYEVPALCGFPAPDEAAGVAEKGRDELPPELGRSEYRGMLDGANSRRR